MNPGDPLFTEGQSNTALALFAGSGDELNRTLSDRCNFQECFGDGADTGNQCPSMLVYPFTLKYNLSQAQQTGWGEHAANRSFGAGCSAEMTGDTVIR